MKVADKGAKRLLQYTLSPHKQRKQYTMKRLSVQQFIDNTGAMTATRYSALLYNSRIYSSLISLLFSSYRIMFRILHKSTYMIVDGIASEK